MSKLTHAQAIKVIREYAGNLVRFHESSAPGESDSDLLVVGFRIKGSFGVGDRFFDAMRSLRKRPGRASQQARRAMTSTTKGRGE